MKKYAIGLDIGGTKCAIVLGRKRSSERSMEEVILDKICFQTETEKGPTYTFDHIFSAIEQILSRNQIQTADLMGIGISCGGPLDSEKGVIMNPPNLIGWDNIPVADMLKEKFRVPVYLQNDANACALAEWKFGAAVDCQNVIFLTFGTGMGAGLILNGALYNGANDMAGEIGHIRLSENGPVGFGKAGSFEGFCSGNGIAQIARTKVMEQLQIGEKPDLCPDSASLKDLTAKSVAEAAENGDALALEIYKTSAYYLGMGLSILIDILNPEMIVMGSIYTRSEELLWPYAKEIIERETLSPSRRNCRIVPAALGEKIGDYAALSVVMWRNENEDC